MEFDLFDSSSFGFSLFVIFKTSYMIDSFPVKYEEGGSLFSPLNFRMCYWYTEFSGLSK